jgi:hypothetical protein
MHHRSSLAFVVGLLLFGTAQCSGSRDQCDLSQMAPTPASLGDWKSPISTEMLTASALKLAASQFAPDGTVTWLEVSPNNRQPHAGQMT